MSGVRDIDEDEGRYNVWHEEIGERRLSVHPECTGKGLRKRMKDEKVRTIFVRNKSKLELE